MALEMQFDDAQYQYTLSEAVQMGVTATESLVEGSLQRVQSAAQTFKTALLEYNTEIQNFNVELQNQRQFLQGLQSESKNDDIDNLVTRYGTTKRNLARKMTITNIGAKIYSVLFFFQDELNTFIGQTMDLIYVVIDADGTPRLRKDIKDVTQFLTYEGRTVNGELKSIEGRFRENHRALTYLENNSEELLLDNSLGLAELNTVHQESVSKYHEHEAGTKMPSKRVMWLSSFPPPTWGLLRLNNTGPINEGYARVIILNQVQNFAGMNEYHRRLEYFMLVYVYASDNAPGALIGDINTGIGTTQTAVKAVNAQTITIEQMDKLADMVLAQNFNIETLRNEIVKELTESHSLLSFEKDYTQEKCEQDIRALMAGYSNLTPLF